MKGKKKGSRGRRRTFKEEGRERRNSMKWGVWSTYPQEWCCSILLRLSVVLNALFIRLCSCVKGRLRHTPGFTADTDTSIMPRSHSASPELTQMPWSCTTDNLLKVIQMTGHPHPTFSTNLSSHRQGYLTTSMQTWMFLYLCSKEALCNTGINIDLLSDRYNWTPQKMF